MLVHSSTQSHDFSYFLTYLFPLFIPYSHCLCLCLCAPISVFCLLCPSHPFAHSYDPEPQRSLGRRAAGPCLGSQGEHDGQSVSSTSLYISKLTLMLFLRTCRAGLLFQKKEEKKPLHHLCLPQETFWGFFFSS